MSNTITEPNHGHQHLLCWKSIIAGVLITIMSYALLTALGAGVLGLTAENAVRNETGGSALASGAGLWLGISAVMSLFLGSYFTLRISKYVSNKVGAAHGFVVASTFFILLIALSASSIGSLSSGLGRIIEGIGTGTASVASNPQVQDVFNNAVGSANLKSSPKDFAQGLAIRLAQGDVASAKSYFSYETGISQAEADQKVTEMKTKFDAAAVKVGEKASAVIADSGLALFVTFFIGLLAALFGGRYGAQSNLKRPIAAPETESSYTVATGRLATNNGSVVPYVFGWLLGVPVSILFLIALLRTVF